MLHLLIKYIDGYLIGHFTLQYLESWLLSNLQGILDSGEEKAIQLADQIDADLVEMSEGLIDEATVRERLESYIRIGETVSSFFSETQHSAVAHATAVSETIRSRLEVPRPVVDLRLLHVFA